jgi:hypothetical protein
MVLVGLHYGLNIVFEGLIRVLIRFYEGFRKVLRGFYQRAAVRSRSYEGAPPVV